jgi:branched-chain amino acid transport system ATP-binding protein
VLILFALLSPEGIQGLAQRMMRRERWTLTSNTIQAKLLGVVHDEESTSFAEALMA